MKKIILTVMTGLLFSVPVWAENPVLNTTALPQLYNLAELLNDGKEGYRLAAEGVTDPKLKTEFAKYSAQRADFLIKLKQEIRLRGGDPDKGGTVPGAVHRGWINIKTAVNRNDNAVLIDEIVRGEEAAANGFAEALNDDIFPPQTKALIESFYNAIKKAHDKALQLKATHRSK